MHEPTSNDNEPAGERPTSLVDASGQAAILLVESLIHGLIARSIISVDDAIEIVDTAAEVRDEIDAESGDVLASRRAPATILSSIAASLKFDQPEQTEG